MALASGTLLLTVSGVAQTSELDLVTANGALGTGTSTGFASTTLTNGTGANQATTFVSDTRTVTSAGEVLDVNGGIVDSFGNIVSFTRIVFLMFKAANTNKGDILISTNIPTLLDLANGDRQIRLVPGGCVAWQCVTAAAYAVVAGTDTITIAGLSASLPAATYDIVIVGS